MAHITLIVEGKLGIIDVRSLLTTVEESVGLLGDLDTQFTKNKNKMLEWHITDIFQGSVGLVLESQSRAADIELHQELGTRVVYTFLEGINALERGELPPYFSTRSLDRLRRMTKIVGRQGTTELSFKNGHRDAKMTVDSAVNIEEVRHIRYTSIGSVERRIEVLDVH